jgi:hypothetical protein
MLAVLVELEELDVLLESGGGEEAEAAWRAEDSGEEEKRKHKQPRAAAQ